LCKIIELHFPNNEFNLTHINIKNTRSYYKVNLSKNKAELKIVSINMLVSVII